MTTATAYTLRVDESGYQVIEYDPPPRHVFQAAVNEAVAAYRQLFGERLDCVWLFGSRAKGDHNPDSDVDLLVVLHTTGSQQADSALLRSVSNCIRSRFGVFIDGHSTTVDELGNADDDFHYFIRREGHRIDE